MIVTVIIVWIVSDIFKKYNKQYKYLSLAHA